jgi:hypothetical protein
VTLAMACRVRRRVFGPSPMKKLSAARDLA